LLILVTMFGKMILRLAACPVEKIKIKVFMRPKDQNRYQPADINYTFLIIFTEKITSTAIIAIIIAHNHILF
jgi:hypothetical protein